MQHDSLDTLRSDSRDWTTIISCVHHAGHDGHTNNRTHARRHSGKATATASTSSTTNLHHSNVVQCSTAQHTRPLSNFCLPCSGAGTGRGKGSTSSDTTTTDVSRYPTHT